MSKRDIMLWKRDYDRFKAAGLSERQMADLLGIRSIPVMRMVKYLIRFFIKHQTENGMYEED